MEFLFNEELGLVVEVDDAKVEEVLAAYEAVQVPAHVIAKTQAANRVKVSVNGVVVLDEDEKALHDLWEATSFELDKLQWNPACAEQEQEGLKRRHKPAWKLTYEPRATPAEWLASASKYRVAIIREEGSNGECEVVVRVAGFEPWDVHARDLLSGRITLEGFRGIVFVGGFSYADVLESARGWRTVGNTLLKLSSFDGHYSRLTSVSVIYTMVVD